MVSAFFTPLLRKLYLVVAIFLAVYLGVQTYLKSDWRRARLYQALVEGHSRQEKMNAAVCLVQLNAQGELLRALKEPSARVRDVAVMALWDAWYHEAGNEAFQMTQATLAASKKHQYALAFKIANNVVKKYPEFAEGWNRRAVLYWETRDYKKSIADCARVVALNPKHFAAWEGMGLCQFYLGDLDKACESLRAAVLIHPHDEVARQFLRHCERLRRKWAPGTPELLEQA